jgi:hypothetical protein
VNRYLWVVLLPGDHRSLEIFLDTAGRSQVPGSIRDGAHSGERDPAERRLIAGEVQCLCRGGGAVNADHDVAGHISPHWTPASADDDHGPGCVRRYLQAH